MKHIRMLSSLSYLWASITYGQPTATIVGPVEMATVPWKPCISVTVSDDHVQLRPIVHPLETEDYYPEPRLTPSGGNATGKTYVGEADSGQFENQIFEIRVAVNPKRLLPSGTILDDWPEAESYSQLVRVVRQSSARDGCPGSRPPKGDLPPDDAKAMPGHDAGQRPREPLAKTSKNEIWRSILDGTIALITDRRVVVGLAVLFILFVIVPPRALRFAEAVWGWLGEVWEFLKSTLGNCTNLLIRVVHSIFSNCLGAVTKVWAQKGFNGDLKRFTAQLIKSPIFWMLFVVCLYADARAVYSGLPMVFETQNSAVPAPTGLTAAFEPTVDDEQGASRTQTPHASAGVGGYLRSLWLDGMLWIIALGISAMQAGIGLVLFSGIEELRLLETGFWALARLRPIPFFSFASLTMALALLALLRGREHGPLGSDLRLPATIAGLIAFSVPWIMAYVLHFAVESTADCLGPIKAFLASLLVGLCGAGMSVLVAGAVAAAIATATILFCGATITGGFAVLFLYSADMTSEAMVKTAQGLAAGYSALREYRSKHIGTAGAAGAAALVGAILAILYIFSKIKGSDL